MSRNYKFNKPEGVYFVSFTVVEWLDVFTRNEYKTPLPRRKRLCCTHAKSSHGSLGVDKKKELGSRQLYLLCLANEGKS